MSRREFDFAALEERMREVARQVPAGPDRFWRLDEALGEFVARQTGIWQPRADLHPAGSDANVPRP